MIRRLLMLTERFPPDLGGVARSSERIAGLLNELGVECHVLSWTKTLPPGQLVSATHRTGEGDTSVTLHRFGLFANQDLSLQHSMNIVEWLQLRHQFEAVWGHYLFPAGFVAVLLGRSLGIPSVVSARGNDVDRLMFPPGDFARLRWTLEHATRVTAVSQDLARKIEILQAPSKRVTVIRNSVNSDLFTPREPSPELRKSLGIAPREVVLGFCGELRHKKGMPFLLQAFQDIRARRDACLLIVGSVRQRDEPMLTAYSTEAPAVRNRMLISGDLQSRKEVADYLNLCDVTLQPSVWDGLPNAVLESMACGKIVIGSDAGGIPEVIDHGVNGFTIPRTQLHRLGEAVDEVLSLPDSERQELESQARKTVVKQFHPSTEAQALATLLAGLTPSAD